MEDVVQKRVWNTKQMITIVGFAITLTFSATMIWGRFLFMENQIQILDERLEKKDNRVNSRIDKIEQDVETLKLPNTDKE